MRRLLLLATYLLGTLAAAYAFGQELTTADEAAWKSLPVWDGGRWKPLDTLARETLQRLTNRSQISDPQSGRRLDACDWYLAMLLDWQGWDAESQANAHGPLSGVDYYQFHLPDKWDQAPLLYVASPQLRQELGLADGEQHIAPLQLNQAKIHVADTAEDEPFLKTARRLARREANSLKPAEKQILDLAARLQAYHDLRMGRSLKLASSVAVNQHERVALADLIASSHDNQTAADGRLRQLQQAFREMRTAAADPERFRRASAAFLSAVLPHDRHGRDRAMPAALSLEVAYNQWLPFRLALAFTLASSLSLAIGFFIRWRLFYAVGWSAAGAAATIVIAGLVMRGVISGHPPLTNLFESIVCAALGVFILGVVYELRHRRGLVLFAAVAIAGGLLAAAEFYTAPLDAAFQPLVQPLQNNLWLTAHVSCAVLGHAAFALAWGAGNITLGFYLFDAAARRRKQVRLLTDCSCRAMRFGVLMLLLGAVLGAMWEDHAHGRFWSWDPKEVAVVIVLICYAAVLAARQAGHLPAFGFAACSTLCFVLVGAAWCGANFVLAAGFHHYGSGSGGEAVLAAAALLQLLYIAAAAAVRLRCRSDDRAAPIFFRPANSAAHY